MCPPKQAAHVHNGNARVSFLHKQRVQESRWAEAEGEGKAWGQMLYNVAGTEFPLSDIINNNKHSTFLVYSYTEEAT